VSLRGPSTVCTVGKPLHVHAERAGSLLGLGLVGGGEGFLRPAAPHRLGVVLAQRCEGVAQALAFSYSTVTQKLNVVIMVA
jgi:hypothetical protein